MHRPRQKLFSILCIHVNKTLRFPRRAVSRGSRLRNRGNKGHLPQQGMVSRHAGQFISRLPQTSVQVDGKQCLEIEVGVASVDGGSRAQAFYHICDCCHCCCLVHERINLQRSLRGLLRFLLCHPPYVSRQRDTWSLPGKHVKKCRAKFVYRKLWRNVVLVQGAAG